VCENGKSKLLVVPPPIVVALVMVTNNNDDECSGGTRGRLEGMKPLKPYVSPNFFKNALFSKIRI
jgi:hypothetical protein